MPRIQIGEGRIRILSPPPPLHVVTYSRRRLLFFACQRRLWLCFFLLLCRGMCGTLPRKKRRGPSPRPLNGEERRGKNSTAASIFTSFFFVHKASAREPSLAPNLSPIPLPEHHCCCCVRSSTYLHAHIQAAYHKGARARWKHGWEKRVREGGPLFAISS